MGGCVWVGVWVGGGGDGRLVGLDIRLLGGVQAGRQADQEEVGKGQGGA